jgi:lipoyl(octanoyl) transferase
MDILFRHLGLVDYTTTWQAMKQFTESREADATDEIWLLQHPRVFTQGQAGKAEHVLAPGDIPVIQVDRGGQVTYHGPGQLVGYLMIDISRKKLGVRQLVSDIENSLVDTLKEWDIESAPRTDAPGVYTGEKKIASLGLRIRHGRSFHGLALNVDMDLEPFRRINPCGYQGLAMTQVKDLSENPDMSRISQRLAHYLQVNLGYNDAHHTTEPRSAV